VRTLGYRPTQTWELGSNAAVSEGIICNQVSSTSGCTPHSPIPHCHCTLVATKSTNHRCPGADGGTLRQNVVNTPMSRCRYAPSQASSKRRTVSSWYRMIVTIAVAVDTAMVRMRTSDRNPRRNRATYVCCQMPHAHFQQGRCTGGRQWRLPIWAPQRTLWIPHCPRMSPSIYTRQQPGVAVGTLCLLGRPHHWHGICISRAMPAVVLALHR